MYSYHFKLSPLVTSLENVLNTHDQFDYIVGYIVKVTMNEALENN